MQLISTKYISGEAKAQMIFFRLQRLLSKYRFFTINMHKVAA